MAPPVRQPAVVSNPPDAQSVPNGSPYNDQGDLNPGWGIDGFGEPVYVGNAGLPNTSAGVEPVAATADTAARENAQAQAQLTAQRSQASQGDWRVKIRLAPGSDYLYNAQEPGILEPLSVTGGVIFPYTPSITTGYSANYNPTDLTHSNYKSYFYQGSSVSEVQITGTFTAQDTFEANYLLAVIHFFKSVTKMFYGQDGNRGVPPPLVFLQGLGEFQYNLAPCVVSNFQYQLPNDVDYIRARVSNIDGTNLLSRRDRTTDTASSWNPSSSRLTTARLPAGGERSRPAPPTLGTSSPTYVPTKMDITVTLLPIQSRAQQSRQFSLKDYANGSLIQRGFW